MRVRVIPRFHDNGARGVDFFAIDDFDQLSRHTIKQLDETFRQVNNYGKPADFKLLGTESYKQDKDFSEWSMPESETLVVGMFFIEHQVRNGEQYVIVHNPISRRTCTCPDPMFQLYLRDFREKGGEKCELYVMEDHQMYSEDRATSREILEELRKATRLLQKISLDLFFTQVVPMEEKLKAMNNNGGENGASS